jgi:hypothetical protein
MIPETLVIRIKNRKKFNIDRALQMNAWISSLKDTYGTHAIVSLCNTHMCFVRIFCGAPDV